MESKSIEFNEWWSEKMEPAFAPVPVAHRNSAYHAALRSWQASRAALVVELPDKVLVEDEFDNGHNCAIDYCAEAIRAAGITVKGEGDDTQS